MSRPTSKSISVLFRLLAILGLALMSACSNPTPGPTQASSSTARPAPSGTPANATPDVNAGNITLTFSDLSMDFEWLNYQPLADAFHKQNPNITVLVIPHQAVQLNLDDYARQADVVYLDGSNPVTLPGFLSLQPLLDASPDFKQSDFWPGSFTACSDDQGTPYSVPLVIQPAGIYYYPRIFDRTHTLYPKAGWTWDQFRQDIAQVTGTKADGSPIYGLVDGPADSVLRWTLNQQFLANNGSLDAQALAASLDWYVQLARQKDLYPYPAPDSQGGISLKDMDRLINNGQAAMWIDMADLAANRPLGNESVYVPFPIDSSGDHTTPAYPVCAAISSGTKSPQAAWAWLQFLSQQDLTGIRQNDGSFSAYQVPARQSLASTSPYWRSLLDDQRSAMQYGLEHAYYYSASLANASAMLWNAEGTILNAIPAGTDLATALQGVALETAPNPQGTVTPTLEPVVLNTVPVPTTMPVVSGDVTAINFMAADFNVVMSFSVYGNRDANLKALATDFMKVHPEIKVNFSTEYEFAKDGNDFQKLSQENDCFEFYGPGMLDYTLDEANLLDLTPFMESNPALKNDFYPQFLQPFDKNGKLYGLPADLDISYIGYNADLLTKLGIPLPKAGWTVDNLISIINQAANLTANPPVYGFLDNQVYIFHALNVPYFDTSVQPPKATFTTDAMTQAMKLMQQLYRSGAVTMNQAFQFGHFQDVAQGRIALWITDGFQNYNVSKEGEYFEKQPIYEKDFPFKVGYVSLPLLASGTPSSQFSIMVGYYISSHASQAKAAACWNWIQYLSDHPSIFGGYIPRQSVLPQESVGKDPEQFAVVQESIQQYTPGGYQEFFDPVLAAYFSELPLNEIFNGADNIPALLTKAQQDSDAYRACMAQKDLTGLNGMQIRDLEWACYAPYAPPTPAPPTPSP